MPLFGDVPFNLVQRRLRGVLLVCSTVALALGLAFDLIDEYAALALQALNLLHQPHIVDAAGVHTQVHFVGQQIEQRARFGPFDQPKGTLHLMKLQACLHCNCIHPLFVGHKPSPMFNHQAAAQLFQQCEGRIVFGQRSRGRLTAHPLIPECSMCREG